MNLREVLPSRWETMHRDGLVVTALLIAAGFGFLACIVVADSLTVYAWLWAALLLVAAAAPHSGGAQVLIPTAPLVWWTANADALTGWSVAAAVLLLATWGLLTLLSAAPDGPPVNRTVAGRYLQRCLLIAAVPVGVWLVARGLSSQGQEYIVVSIVALLVLAAGILLLPQLTVSAPAQQGRGRNDGADPVNEVGSD